MCVCPSLIDFRDRNSMWKRALESGKDKINKHISMASPAAYVPPCAKCIILPATSPVAAFT